jgi:aconitate hydratase 2/2-methylisocitrate dehydratase
MLLYLVKLQTFAATTLNIEPQVYAASKISIDGQGLTAVEKIFNKKRCWDNSGKVLHAGSDVRVK